MNAFHKILLYAMLGITTACTADIPFTWDEGSYSAKDDDNSGYVADNSNDILEYDGTLASDASNDIVGSDKSIYWEANSFTNKIYVTYNNSTASVETSTAGVITNIDGAYVTIDLETNTIKNADIVVSGTSDNGSLKIYGAKKFKLTLNSVQLESKRGPAINNQCKKRVFVHLTDGTRNVLKDSRTYTAESYYRNGLSMDTEDAKGCLFSESNIIFSGTGMLDVFARHNHGIAADGYVWVRPGVTLAIEESAKNCIHAKGSTSDNLGVVIAGGYIYANTSANAGKCIKTDNNIVINGGILALNCSAQSVYNTEDDDLSHGACMKSDLSTAIHSGIIIAKSTEDDTRNIHAKGNLSISGGKIYSYSAKGYTIYSPTISIDGGTVLCVCANTDLSAPSQSATINGGYVVSVGNSALSTPSSQSKQSYVSNSVFIDSGSTISLVSDSKCLVNYTSTLGHNINSSILFSCPDIANGTPCSIVSGVIVTDNTDYWYGLSFDGTYKK